MIQEETFLQANWDAPSVFHTHRGLPMRLSCKLRARSPAAHAAFFPLAVWTA